MRLGVSVLTLTLLCDTQAKERKKHDQVEQKKKSYESGTTEQKKTERMPRDGNQFIYANEIHSRAFATTSAKPCTTRFNDVPWRTQSQCAIQAIQALRTEARHHIRILQFSVAFVAIFVCQWIRYESCWQLDVLVGVLLAFFGAHLSSVVLPPVELCNSSHFASCFIFRPLQEMLSQNKSIKRGSEKQKVRLKLGPSKSARVECRVNGIYIAVQAMHEYLLKG